MNEHLRPPLQLRRPGTTQAADGLPRRAWTVEEIDKMLEAGILEHGERFELIGGELVAMASKGLRHELLKIALNKHWVRLAPEEITIAPETAFRMGEHDTPEPEFIVYPTSILAHEVRGDSVILVVEIADSSLTNDRNIKGPRYAAAGVREYWVIAARTLITTVYRDPSPDGYRSRQDFAPNELLTPLLASSLAVRLDQFELG